MAFGIYTRFRNLRRKACEQLGIPWYSRPAAYDLDRKLARHLTRRDGFFIECGANDGFAFSNTYYLERIRGWRGLLIEAIPDLAARCRVNRPNALVVECALVPFSQDGQPVEMEFGNLMSVVKGALGAEEEEHLRLAQQCEPALRRYRVSVPGRALSHILDEHNIQKVDFFSLDVEGFEAQVLQGIDWNRHRPAHILVEARNRPAIEAILNPHYELAEELNRFDHYSDLLYRLRP